MIPPTSVRWNKIVKAGRTCNHWCLENAKSAKSYVGIQDDKSIEMKG